MAATPSPTWYDVLGVPPDATPEEIKAAWRHATDTFQPGSGTGRFRTFNEAADVLLDPVRRAAYDESLSTDTDRPQAQREDDDTEDAPTPPPAAVVPAAGSPRRTSLRRRPVREEPQDGGSRASRVAVVLTFVLAVLTVAAVVAAVFLGLKVRTDGRIADARDEAPAAAEAAAKAVLAYDYRHLPADRDRAEAYLTPGFRRDYLKNFALLEKQKDGSPGAAVQTKTVVTASVLGSGVIDAEENLVRVLVYVNQTSTKAGKDPQIFQNRVAMTMKRQGDRWLVDDLKSY